MADQLVTVPFSADEYADRVARAREKMERRGLDLILITIPENIFYLTGFQTGTVTTFPVLVLPLKGDAAWVVRKTELSNIQALTDVSWVKTARGVDDSEDPIDILAGVIRGLDGPKTAIGVEHNSYYFTIAHYLKLQRELPQVEWHDVSDILANLRVIKSPAELVYMRRAGEITASATKSAIESLREGMLDSELAANLITAAIRHGSGPMALGPHVTTGKRTFLAHSSWVGVEIQQGDLVNTELAANVAHYNAPVFRVAVMGQPSDEVQRFHDASRAGLMAGLEGIKPGMTSEQGDAVVRRSIEQIGLGEYFVVRAAYGIGIGFPPSWSETRVMQIRPNDPRRLEVGMCFHLVPALYKRDLGAVCCSMSIELTEDGCRPLTPIEPELFVV